MRVSELADRVGVAPSTVRYYERIGLLPPPRRTASGYRSYDEDAATRLLFVTRAKRMGLTLEQIADVLRVWEGGRCPTTHAQIRELLEAKQAEIAEQIAELQALSRQLDEARQALDASPPPPSCVPDLSCCVPETDAAPVRLRLGADKARRSTAKVDA